MYNKENMKELNYEKTMASCKNGRVVFHINDSESFSVYNCSDRSFVFEGKRHRIGASAVPNDAPDIDRMLLRFELPKVFCKDDVQSARLTVYQYTEENAARNEAFIGVQRIKDDINVDGSAPTSETNIIDFCKVKAGKHTKLRPVRYDLDITKAVIAEIENGSSCCAVQLRMLDEIGDFKNNVYIYGSESSEFKPQIVISYNNNPKSASIDKCHTNVSRAEKANILSQMDGVIRENATNLLQNHSFYTLHHWKWERVNAASFNSCCHLISRDILFGTRCYKIFACNEFERENGVYQDTIPLSSGDYTFSVYMRVRREIIGGEGSGAYIRVTDTSGKILAESCRLTQIDRIYSRLNVKFSLKECAAVRIHILVDGRGEILVDGAQLERGPLPTEYNMIENGGFEFGMSNWDKSNGEICCTEITAYEGIHSLQIKGFNEKIMSVSQTVYMNPNTEENASYMLSAMAKVEGEITFNDKTEKLPIFELRAEATYVSYDTGKISVEKYTAQYSPNITGWQFASVIVKEQRNKALYSLKVICDYSYNTGVAYFDSVCLKKSIQPL